MRRSVEWRHQFKFYCFLMTNPKSLAFVQQKEFQPVVKDLLSCLRSQLGDSLHSVYIYGSVANGTAIIGQSNLDVVVVSKQDFSSQKQSLFNTINWRFQREFPQVNGVSIRTALVEEITSLDAIFTWGFLLKQCCTCLYGDDLSECFGEYIPSWEIAKHWNNDTASWVQHYRMAVAKAQDTGTQVAAQQAIAKKLLRASYSLVLHKSKRWLDCPRECGEQFVKYYPEQAVYIERLNILLGQRAIAKRSVVGLLDLYGDWLAQEYKKTEFKIG